MSRLLSRFTLSLLLVCMTAACHPAPPNLDPATTRMWQADQVQVILGELQHTAISFNTVKVCPTPNSTTDCRPLLSDKNTGVVVDTVTSALLTLRKAPDGWNATGLAALEQISSALDAVGKTQLAAYIDAARVALGLILKSAATAAPPK